MDLLEYLINVYEEHEGMTVDEVLSDVLKQDPRLAELSKEEVVELKRRFLDYVRDSEDRNIYEDREKKSYMIIQSISW